MRQRDECIFKRESERVAVIGESDRERERAMREWREAFGLDLLGLDKQSADDFTDQGYTPD
jgi:hypothetical protein